MSDETKTDRATIATTITGAMQDFDKVMAKTNVGSSFYGASEIQALNELPSKLKSAANAALSVEACTNRKPEAEDWWNAVLQAKLESKPHEIHVAHELGFKAGIAWLASVVRAANHV
jgi:hypothetical protein